MFFKLFQSVDTDIKNLSPFFSSKETKKANFEKLIKDVSQFMKYTYGVNQDRMLNAVKNYAENATSSGDFNKQAAAIGNQWKMYRDGLEIELGKHSTASEQYLEQTRQQKAQEFRAKQMEASSVSSFAQTVKFLRSVLEDCETGLKHPKAADLITETTRSLGLLKEKLKTIYGTERVKEGTGAHRLVPEDEMKELDELIDRVSRFLDDTSQRKMDTEETIASFRDQVAGVCEKYQQIYRQSCS